MSAVSDFLYILRGIAMELHTELGCDHQEAVYERMLHARLEKLGYQMQRQPTLFLRDDYDRVVKKLRPDLRVRSKGISVLIELKADPKGVHGADERQARSYLSTSRTDQAVLLLNFGTPKLGHYHEYQRGRA